ncbi:MAG: nicotinate-nucleotide adenylyltransferase [Verrucomicrobiales bacterium]|jgi:nicotinate-nucleotide adenylyltransferase
MPDEKSGRRQPESDDQKLEESGFQFCVPSFQSDWFCSLKTENRHLKTSKLALFGGSFDPIHLGHTSLAQQTFAAAGLDRVIFVPCRQSPHKTKPTEATAEQRCEMIRLATSEFDWAELSQIEIDRDEPSFSWLTAKEFAEREPEAELFWILGADQWDALETWAKPEILAELLTFLVFPRANSEPIAPKTGFRSQQLPEFLHPASSTSIRDSAESAREFLDPKVFDYARSNQIYG